MAHVSKWKETEVNTISQMIKEGVVIGTVSVDGVPSPQFQGMRRDLRGKCSIKMVKNRLLARALEVVKSDKPGIEKLVESIDGQMALITTDTNPFKLFQYMESTKTAAPAKGGEIAPDDVKVEAGDTGFKPGPIVGELQKAGIPAAIEQGKVVIKKDKVMVKAGEPIPAHVAPMLTRLSILPLEVGLNLCLAYEDGTVYDREILDIDVEAFLGDVSSAAGRAFNMAVNIGYVNSLTIPILISKARTEAFNLAINAGVMNSETVPHLISMANSQMMALASQVPDALDDDLKGMLGSASAQQAAPAQEEAAPAEEKSEEKTEEEEEASEEEAAAGLGALFG